jgi:hypothetical protein
MAISTQDIDFTDPIRNVGLDSTSVFGELPSNRTEHLSSENLSAASKVDDDDEDDMEDDEDEDDEDEDEDDEDEDRGRGRKTSTMRRTKTRMKTMKMRMKMKRMRTTKTWTNFRFASGVSCDRQMA